MAAVKGAAKGRQTQWAAQFLAAAELVRRGYTVSFTMGNNTPVADLMVGTPSSELFWVDVKGQASKMDWLVTPKPAREKLFYVLVYLSPLANAGETRAPDRFFILMQEEANRLEKDYREARPGRKHTMLGFAFKDPLAFEGRWDKLPV